MKAALIRTKGDISKIPSTATVVRIQNHLTLSMAEALIQRCPQLEKVILTNWAAKKATQKSLAFLAMKRIGIEHDKRTQGMPVKLTREQVAEIKASLADPKRTQTQAEIAEKYGVSAMTVSRIKRGLIKFLRWRSEYE